MKSALLSAKKAKKSAKIERIHEGKASEIPTKQAK